MQFFSHIWKTQALKATTRNTKNAGECVCVFDIAPLFQMATGLHEIVGLGAKNNPYRTTEAYLDSDA